MIPEELLCEAAARSCEAYVSYLEADYDAGETYEFSKAFEKRIDRLKRRADHPIFYQTVRRVAIILIAILFAGTIWIAIDSDARAAFFGWFGEYTGYYYDYHHVGSARETEEAAHGAPAGYRPIWIPEGYAEKSVRVFNDKTTVLYVNDSGELVRFSYVITSRDYNWSFDFSQGETVDCQVGDQPANLFRSHTEKTSSAVTWIGTDNTAFHVTGFVSEEELLKMAESVHRLDYLPTWIPEGYAEKSVRVFDDETTVRYLNDSGELLRFSYVITSEDVDWFFDVSQGETLDCQVGDQPGTLFRSHAEKTAGSVTWIGADDTAFHVTGFISEEDLIRMAESVN